MNEQNQINLRKNKASLGLNNQQDSNLGVIGLYNFLDQSSQRSILDSINNNNLNEGEKLPLAQELDQLNSSYYKDPQNALQNQSDVKPKIFIIENQSIDYKEIVKPNSNTNILIIEPNHVEEEEEEKKNNNNEIEFFNSSIAKLKNKGISIQIHNLLRMLNTKADQFNQEYHKLFEVQKLLPDTTKVIQNNDFVTTITNFKTVIQKLQRKPQEFLGLQHQIVERISLLFCLSYKIELGDLETENSDLIEGFIQLKADFEEKCFNIKEFNITELISNITQSLKDIYGSKINENQSTTIEKLMLEMNNIIEEKKLRISDLCDSYKQYLITLSNLENNLHYNKKEIEDLSLTIQILNRLTDEMDKQTENNHSDFKQKKKANQELHRKQKEDYQTMFKYLEQAEDKERDEAQKKWIIQTESLTNYHAVFNQMSYSTKMDCLNYNDKDKSLKQIQNHFKTQRDDINKSLIEAKDKRLQKQNQSSSIQSQILTLKNSFYSQKLKSDKSESATSIENRKNIQEHYENKINTICQEFDAKTLTIKAKIDNIRLRESKAIEKNKQLIERLGFQNINHYQKFQNLYESISEIYKLAMGLKQGYIIIIEFLIGIGQMLKLTKDLFQKNTAQMNKLDTIDSIIEYYQKFDKSINLADKSESKGKIHMIWNCSIWQMCIQEGKKKEELYKKCVSNLEFNVLFALQYQDNKTLEKDIMQDVIPQIIQYSKLLLKSQNKTKQLRSKIEAKTQEIEEIEETENNLDDAKQEKKLQKLELELKTLKTQLKDKKNFEKKLLQEYYDNNFDDIQVVKQITYSFIKAIQFASNQLKYEFAVKPYLHYISTVTQVEKSFQNFENPRLLSSSQKKLQQ